MKHMATNTPQPNKAAIGKNKKFTQTEESSFMAVKEDPADYLTNMSIQDNFRNYQNFYKNLNKLMDFIYHFTYVLKEPKEVEKARKRLSKTLGSPHTYFTSKNDTQAKFQHFIGTTNIGQFENYESMILTNLGDYKNKCTFVDLKDKSPINVINDFASKFFGKGKLIYNRPI